MDETNMRDEERANRGERRAALVKAEQLLQQIGALDQDYGNAETSLSERLR